MAEDFEVVDRPRGSGKVPDALIKALIETLDSTKAVRMKLAPGAFTTWQANVRAQLKSGHNLRLRTKNNKATHVVTAWVEKFDGRETGEFTDEELGVSEDNA